jgi:hypothetical protein
LKKPPDLGFEEATPAALDGLFEQQPAFSNMTEQHIPNRMQQPRNQVADALTA